MFDVCVVNCRFTLCFCRSRFKKHVCYYCIIQKVVMLLDTCVVNCKDRFANLGKGLHLGGERTTEAGFSFMTLRTR